MHISLQHIRHRLCHRLILGLTLLPFIWGGVVPVGTVAAAQNMAAPLPQPGSMVSTTERFVPTLLKGIMINPAEPFQLDFIVDTGQRSRSDEGIEEEKIRLIKYFMASLTVPEDDLWVNLSPFEQQRIIPEKFGFTDMGRDLLAQDYLLKQLTATLMYPEKELGQQFWDRIYQIAQSRFGTTDIPVNTFNKVWIIPEEAVIYEQGNAAYIVSTRLKVMLEEDYIALDKNLAQRTQAVTPAAEENEEGAVNSVASQVIREVILPAIEEEVNHGKNFATLRQIYHSLILASWYKETIKTSLINQLYSDQNKINGIDIDDKEIKDKIYRQYIEAFEEGVYSYIKEEFDPLTQEVIPRKYFSGGVRFRLGIQQGVIRRTTDTTGITAVGDTEVVAVGLLRSNRRDQALLASRTQWLTGTEATEEANTAVVAEWMESLKRDGFESDFTESSWIWGESLFRRTPANMLVLRSRDDDQIIGLASFRLGQMPSTDLRISQQRVYFVDYMEVHPKFRGAGYGKIILSEIIRQSFTDSYWDDVTPDADRAGELVVNPALELDGYFEKLGFRELPRDASDDQYVYDGSPGTLQQQRKFYLNERAARVLLREGQQLKAQPEDAERWARIAPLYEAQAEDTLPGEQLGLFPEGLDEATGGERTDSAILARPNWQRFVPHGIEANPPWRREPAYADFSTSMGSNANALSRIRLFNSIIEEESLRIPDAFRRGAILGFGEGATELLGVQSAYNIQEVHGVEWVGDRVQSAAEGLSQRSAFPNQFVLHHANMADLKNQFGPATFDFVYAGLISDDNSSAPVKIAREVVRILQPGGYAFIDEGNPAFIEYLQSQGEVTRWGNSGIFIFRKAGIRPADMETVNGLTSDQQQLITELTNLQAVSPELGRAVSADAAVSELFAQSQLFRDNPLVRLSAGYRPTDSVGMFGYGELPGWIGGMRLRPENQFYFKALQQHAPQIVAYAQSLLDNPAYAQKKFVAMGRGADLIYDAMIALTYLDSRYAGRRDDITIIDFSSENILELATPENIGEYREMFRRQLSRQLNLSTFNDLVFINEVASERNATQGLLAQFLDVPFDYTAGVVYDNIETRSGSRYDGSRDTAAFDWLDTEYQSGRQYQIQAFPVFGLGHQYGVTPFQRFLNQEAVYAEVYRQTSGISPAPVRTDRAVLSVSEDEFARLQSTLDVLQNIAGQLDVFVNTRGLRDYRRDLEQWIQDAAQAVAEAEQTGTIPESFAELERRIVTLNQGLRSTVEDFNAYRAGEASFLQIFAGIEFTFFNAEGDALQTQDSGYASYDYIDKLNKSLASAMFAGDMITDDLTGDRLENMQTAVKFASTGLRNLGIYFGLLRDTLNPSGIQAEGFELGLEKDAFPETTYGEFLLPYAQVLAARRDGEIDRAVLVNTYVSDAAGFLRVDAELVRAALAASLDGETGLRRFARRVGLSPNVILTRLEEAGLARRNPQRGELGFDFTDAFYNADTDTEFIIPERGERNLLHELTRFMLEELDGRTFQAELSARGIDLQEGANADRIAEVEQGQGILPVLLGLLRRAVDMTRPYPEIMLEQENQFARVLRNTLFGSHVSRESQKRNLLLGELGDDIQRIAREVLASPNLQISISTLGSTLRGYADTDSDIEYKIHILSGLADESTAFLSEEKTAELYQRINALINETARRRGESYFADEKFIGQSPTVNWKFVLSTSADDYMNNYRRTMSSDPQLFLPQVYGDAQLIDQMRAAYIAHTDMLAANELGDFAQVRWNAVRNNLVQDHMASFRVDSPALDRMKTQQGISSYDEYEDWLNARFSVPDLAMMRDIYSQQIAQRNRSATTESPRLEPQMLAAYEAYVDQLGTVLSELQDRRAGDQVWFIFDNQYWDNLPANSMALDRRSGDFLIHLHTNEGDLTRGFMFRINPDAEEGEPIFDKFWIEETSSQGFVDGQRFVDAGYITPEFARQLLEDATAVMRQDDGFTIMDKYPQMRKDFYPLMQDVIKNNPGRARFVIGAVQDDQQRDVLINIFTRRRLAPTAEQEGVPATLSGPGNASYPVTYKLNRDAARLSPNPVGGIDLTPNNLNINVRRDPNGVPVPLTPQQIQDVNINGLYPVIINTIPITNVPLLLGVADRPPAPTDLSQGPETVPVAAMAERDQLSLLH